MIDKIKVLGNNILVQPNEPEKAINGILIPETSNVRASKGKVLAVGQGEFVDDHFKPISISVGDTVLFMANVGVEVDLDDLKKLRVIPENDIIAVLAN